MTNHTEEATRPWTVCTNCKGEGHVGPGHVFTQEDRDEYDPQDFDDMMADYRDGKYDVSCPECEGRRVIKAECQCEACEEDRADIAEMWAQQRAEIAFGC